MGVAKVTLNGTTLMDTTGMTVTSNTMVSAATALDKAGEVVTGTIATKTSNDITVNGSTVTVPAGVYNTAATKTVASAAAFAPAITLASSTGVVTGTNTFAAGYYSASTKTSTFNLTTQAGKTVTPTEAAQVAVSSYRWTTGTVSVAAISSNYVGTNITRRTATDLTANLSTVTAPAGYYSSQVTKNVTSASAFAPAITLNSSTGAVTGTNTFTSAYYAASTKTSTLNLTTKAAQTYTPTTTTQYISSYRWLTGSQTILGDANLVASNIASGVSIFGVTGTHQGGGDFTHTITLLNDGWYTAQGAERGYISLNNVGSYSSKTIISYSSPTTIQFYLSTYTGSCTLYINGSLISESKYIHYSYSLISYPLYVNFDQTHHQIQAFEDTIPIYMDANEVQY